MNSLAVPHTHSRQCPCTLYYLSTPIVPRATGAAPRAWDNSYVESPRGRSRNKDLSKSKSTATTKIAAERSSIEPTIAIAIVPLPVAPPPDINIFCLRRQ
jgi:hypothetical protein